MPLCVAFAPALVKGSCQKSCWSHERSRMTYCTARLKTAALHLLLYCLLCCTLLPFNFYPYVSGLHIPFIKSTCLHFASVLPFHLYLFNSTSPTTLKKKKISFPASFYSVSILRWAKLNSFRADVRPPNSVRTTEKFHNCISFCSVPFYFISAYRHAVTEHEKVCESQAGWCLCLFSSVVTVNL